MLESHRGTTFEDLKAGLAFLKRKVDGENETQLSFIKANVNSIVDQLVPITLGALNCVLYKTVQFSQVGFLNGLNH